MNDNISPSVIDDRISVDSTRRQPSRYRTALRFDAGKSEVLRQVAATILVVILIAVFAKSTYFKNETYDNSCEVWNVFVYYLNAKYFSEVGYFNLYTCALEADHEASGYWDRIVGARDMETYHILPRSWRASSFSSSLPACPRTNFTTEQWSKFSRDVEYFATLAPPTYYSQVFTDKSFNPPPSWTSLARPVAQAVPIYKIRLADVIFNLDVIAVLIGMLIIWRSRGGIAALLTAGLVIFYFGNFGRLGGSFLLYVWFPFLVAAIVLWTKNRPGFSGAMLGVAAGLQIFPVFFGLPIVVRGIIELVQRRKKAEWHPYFKFSGGLIGVVVASFLLGSLAGRGVGAWREWQEKISIHKNYLQGEIFNIGLATLAATAVSQSHNDATYYSDDVSNTFMRLDSLRRNRLLYYDLCALFFLTWVLTVVSAPANDLFGHGFLIMYTAVNLSPYYYLPLALIPFIFWKAGRPLRLYATCGTVVLFAAHIIYFRGGYVSFRYLPHLLSSCSIALFLLGIAAVSLVSYVFARQQHQKALSHEMGGA